jgi:DNA polymerase I
LMFNSEYADIDSSKGLLKKFEKTPVDEWLLLVEDTSPGVSARAKSANCTVDQYLRLCAFYRNAAKSIGFGLNYGMGATKLANDLGISVQEAKGKIEQYKQTYPAVDRFMLEAVEEARLTGYAFTIMGRRRNLPMILSPNKGERALGERMCVNTQIQGSAANVVQMAQINIDCMRFDITHGVDAILQIHDELVFQMPIDSIDEVGPQIENALAHPFSMDLACPLDAEIGYGRSWAEAK